MSKTWLIEFPTYQYKEDVVQLASKNDLVIVDAKFKDLIDPKDVAKDTPKLTKNKAAK